MPPRVDDVDAPSKQARLRCGIAASGYSKGANAAAGAGILIGADRVCDATGTGTSTHDIAGDERPDSAAFGRDHVARYQRHDGEMDEMSRGMLKTCRRPCSLSLDTIHSRNHRELVQRMRSGTLTASGQNVSNPLARVH